MNHPKNPISRRDFLKLASLLPLTAFSSPIENLLTRQRSSDNLPGVIVLIFDAWSAKNMNLFGYPLQTMPNFERFVEKTTIYHNHYSAGSFTIPGTASILTGLYPWSHRAFTLGAGGVAREHIDHQLFFPVL